MAMYSQQFKWKLLEDAKQIVYLDSCPFTPGTTIVETKRKDCTSVFQLPLEEYNNIFLEAKKWAKRLCEKIPVQRCAMISEPKYDTPPQIKLIPLHGLGSDWKPIIDDKLEFHDEYPGYFDSRNGPRASDDSLKMIQDKIRAKLQSQSESFEFFGDMTNENLFAKIVRGEIQQWRIWEDKGHVAFLTPFPNTPGFTVLVPRKHLPSDLFSLEIEDYKNILHACYQVNPLLKESMNAESCCMIFEGYEIDYAHAKLIPLIQKSVERKKLVETDFCSSYQGYVSSMNGSPANNDELKKFQSILKY